MLTAIASVLGLLLLAYVLGSIPTGYLAGRWIGGFDIRERGSGGTGATNVLRNLGKGPAAGVLAVDVFKGVAAVVLVRSLFPLLNLDVAPLSPELASAWLVSGAALAALLGHSWPVWLGFRGGKSVATGLGVLLAMVWPVGLGALGTFALVLAMSRIVSLSSISAAIVISLLMLMTGAPLPYLLFGLAGGLYVIIRHRSNMQRILAGTEPRIGQSAPQAATQTPAP